MFFYFNDELIKLNLGEIAQAIPKLIKDPCDFHNFNMMDRKEQFSFIEEIVDIPDEISVFAELAQPTELVERLIRGKNVSRHIGEISHRGIHFNITQIGEQFYLRPAISMHRGHYIKQVLSSMNFYWYEGEMDIGCTSPFEGLIPLGGFTECGHVQTILPYYRIPATEEARILYQDLNKDYR
jgi:hypothetical protein